jgi:hypothetical protein
VLGCAGRHAAGIDLARALAEKAMRHTWLDVLNAFAGNRPGTEKELQQLIDAREGDNRRANFVEAMHFTWSAGTLTVGQFPPSTAPLPDAGNTPKVVRVLPRPHLTTMQATALSNALKYLQAS